MLNRTAYSALMGLMAGTLMSGSVFAGNITDTAYLVDSSKKPIMSGSGCVLTPKSQKSMMFEACGDNADSDGDGVNNDKDKCPGTPKGVKVDENGCALDSDKDGVANYQDKCPNNTPAEIAKGVYKSGANIGCPMDSDGDGVPDYRDQCPGTPANTQVDANGCAVISTRVTATLSEVHFDFDKAAVKPKGQQLLGKLIKFINSDNAHVKSVEVGGHTDKIGAAGYNQKLSERRAKAVGNYLRSNGVTGAKISTKGYGETQLKATNKESRRVEITVNKTNKK